MLQKVRWNIANICDFLSNIFGIMFAITAFAPGSLIDLVVPWANNRFRNYVVIIVGMLILAPINIPLSILTYGFELLADLLSTEDYSE